MSLCPIAKVCDAFVSLYPVTEVCGVFGSGLLPSGLGGQPRACHASLSFIYGRFRFLILDRFKDLSLFFKIYFYFLCMDASLACMSLHMHICGWGICLWMQVPAKAKKGIKIPGAEVTGLSEPPKEGVRTNSIPLQVWQRNVLNYWATNLDLLCLVSLCGLNKNLFLCLLAFWTTFINQKVFWIIDLIH